MIIVSAFIFKRGLLGRALNLAVFLLGVMVFPIGAWAQRGDSEGFVKGIYGNPDILLKKGYSFQALGINAIFIHKGSITPALMEKARKEKVKVFAEFPLLNGKDYLKDHPDAWPIDSNGNRSPQADWFMGICPTHPGFRKYREEQLMALLTSFQIDGVWLDYVHHHAQFESPQPILPETCFCNHCLSAFQKQAHVTVPEEGGVKEKATWILKNKDKEWRAWRSDVIVSWVRDFKTLLKAQSPSAKLGVFYCPWFPEDFNGAGYRTLGLDVPALYQVADVLSPMIYHGRMGRGPEWVKEYMDYFQRKIKPIGQGAQIWPIVQASNEPKPVSPDEFRKVMDYGSSGPSSGVMMFSTGAFREDTTKIEVMKDLYLKGNIGRKKGGRKP